MLYSTDIMPSEILIDVFVFEDDIDVSNFKRRKEWNNERFPPTVEPHPDHRALVEKRWKEYGL